MLTYMFLFKELVLVYVWIIMLGTDMNVLQIDINLGGILLFV